MVRECVSLYGWLDAPAVVTSLGAAALRHFHAQNASIMLLFWQFGTVAVLTSIAAILVWKCARQRCERACPMLEVGIFDDEPPSRRQSASA